MNKLLSFAIVFFLLQSVAGYGATVRQFSPQGEVGRQARATAEFDADMVKLGDTSSPAPFIVNCGAVQGEGRWSAPRFWAWQLARPLQAGERCEFTLRSDLTALNGEALSGRSRFAFFAGPPRPYSIYPHPGREVEEDQVFIVDAGGAVTRESLEKNVWCEADGVGNRIALRLVADELRRAVLTAHRNFGADALVLACTERLPPGVKMKLVWGKGVESVGGAKSVREENFVYPVRQPLRAELSCEREKAGAPCSPLSPVSVKFSAYIDSKLLRKIRLVTPEGARSPRDPDKDGGERENNRDSVIFPGPFAQNAELTLELPAALQDDAGRALCLAREKLSGLDCSWPDAMQGANCAAWLFSRKQFATRQCAGQGQSNRTISSAQGISNAAAFPLKFRTGGLPPLAKFPGAFGIVELKEGGVLPVTLRNVEPSLKTADVVLPGSHRFADKHLSEDADVIATMRALAEFEKCTKTVKIMRDGKPERFDDPWCARELSFLGAHPGVTRTALPKPGGSAEFEVVGIPLGKPGYHVVEIESQLLGAALLATPKPMYVRASVLVTNLAVHLKRGKDNGLVWVTYLDSGKPAAGAAVRVSNCDGKEQWRGKTDAQGRALIDIPLPTPACKDHNFLFASARLEGDYSFVRSDWNEGLEPWRFGVESWGEARATKFHTVFDRPQFRTGQTVAMKHFARSRNSRGFAFPDASRLPDKLVIRHSESNTEYTQALHWDAQGSATSQWKAPEAAKRGEYQVLLSGDKLGMVESGAFRVADFRLPVFTGSIQGAPPRQVAPAKIPLALGLSFLNGGAAQGAAVTVSSTLRPRWPTYPGYEKFSFKIDFDNDGLAAFGVEREWNDERLVLDKQPLTLDRAGAGKLEVALPTKPVGPTELYSEMTFTDPNGEIQTIHGNVELWPAAVTLGMHIPDWTAKDGARVELVVLDSAGKPLAGQDIVVRAKRRIDYSHRRRIVGGFYAYENHHEFTDLGELCKGRSDARGLLFCRIDKTEAGRIYLLAETRDAKGNVARSGSDVRLFGGGDDWFSAGNQDRIDVIPEKRSYQPGETARFQVRTPFREATALISMEAGGVIETFVQPLSRFNPTIELPVKASWAPNVYISVLLVRGRVTPLKWYSLFQWGWREPAAWFREWWQPQQPSAFVDLAKPAFRIGLAEIGVGDDGFRLKVEVSADKPTYRPREEATVHIRATAPDGKALPAGAEVAFAAVDQALLELRPNESWNLLEAFLQKRAYEVQTATAQSQVIGKRHFGKKAVPPGGGGGRSQARELFDTLLVWQPRVKLAPDGSATLKFAMNDALTEFKLAAIASAGTGLFGTGSASVRTGQDLQMTSGLPPLVREKDRFTGLLTLRNATARAMNVNVAASIGGKAQPPRKVSLAAQSATELAWVAQAPEGAESLAWEFEAREEGGAARDKLKITQQIAPAVPVTVQQASFTRIEGKVEIPTMLPTGALPGKGGVEIGLSKQLAAPPPGLKRFFAEYPFSCLEQRVSIAAGLHDAKRWQEIAAALPSYLDRDGLARYFPGEGSGSVTLTAYLLDIAAVAGFALPDDARRLMLDGLAAFAEGRIKPKYWSPQDDLTARKLSALEALTRYGRNPARSAAALDVEPLRLPSAALIDWYLVTQRLTDLPRRTEQLAAAEQELRNRLAYTGGRLNFTTERADYWWWMMVSGDSNAFRLIEAVLD
ncbi:MAG: MG2 domain-containing protein, partial [Sulfuricellaceae bacterium]